MKNYLLIEGNSFFPEINVLVVVGGSESYWHEYFSESDMAFCAKIVDDEKKVISEDDHNGCCKFMELSKDGWESDVPVLLIHFAESLFDHPQAPDTFSNGVIGHECLHAAQYIMDEYEIGYHEKEFFARIHQWLFTTISGWVYENFVQEDEVVKDRE